VRRCTALLVVCLAVGASACGGAPDPAVKAKPGSVELRVMSFNIWYGGVSVDFGQIAAAIRAADADIVGVQEPEGNLRRLADAAGLPYVDESLHLISRFPLFAVERGGVRFAYAEVARDRVVAVENMHLTCCPYGPNLVKAGKPAEDVIALERRVRLPEAEEYVDALAPLIDDDVPLFVTGDFNSPSHLDWTAEATEARDLPYPLEWPASKAFADAGFRDSYRDAHPDPAAEPGLTWTAGQPPPRMRPSETNDRIDWVLAAGPSVTLSSGVVGEQGGPDVEVGVSPWGSDHRAVVSSFAAEPAPAPYLVSAEPRVVEAGGRVTLRYTLAGGGPGRTVGIVAGRDPAGKPEQTIPIYDASDHIAPMLGTAGLAPGRYSAVLLDGDGGVLASSEFWIAARDAQPAIETTRASFAPGEPVGVRWQDAPANKLDYVAIFKAADPSVYGYLGFLYTGARPEGTLEFTKADTGRLAPGRYVARLMLDDGYSVLAGAPFTVGR
jgi:endonuclease/exonuclease/phosphatase family metal-dependent hydrolase